LCSPFDTRRKAAVMKRRSLIYTLLLFVSDKVA
jgi:hypothetical protein